MTLIKKHNRLDDIQPEIDRLKNKDSLSKSDVYLIEFEYNFLGRRLWYAGTYPSCDADWRLGHAYKRYLAHKDSRVIHNPIFEFEGLEITDNGLEGYIKTASLTENEKQVIRDNWKDYRWLINPSTGNKYQQDDKPPFLSDRQAFNAKRLLLERKYLEEPNFLLWTIGNQSKPYIRKSLKSLKPEAEII